MIPEFEEILKTKSIVLVEFYTEWFAACKLQDPIIEEIAEDMEERIKVITIDTERYSQLARHYSIQAVPSILVFKEGVLIFQKAGIMSKPQIMNIILQNLPQSN